MWTLEVFPHGPEGVLECRYIFKGPKCVVGRAIGLDISFSEDKSISRNHAELHLTSDLDGSEPYLSLVDAGSRYGTYVDGVKMEPNGTTRLSSNECVVRLGSNKCCIVVKKQVFRFCFTQLDKAEKDLVKTICNDIGALVIVKAEKATHIIAKTLSATVKTLIALTLGLHMVSLDWVNRLRSHGSPLIVLEDEKNHKPTLAPRIILEDPAKSRQGLFDNITILLVHPIDEQYDIILLRASGTVVQYFSLEESRKLQQIMQSAREKDQTVCVFFDESRGADYPADLAARFAQYEQIRWLTARSLATSILSCSAPMLLPSFPAFWNRATAASQSQAQSIQPSAPPALLQQTLDSQMPSAPPQTSLSLPRTHYQPMVSSTPVMPTAGAVEGSNNLFSNMDVVAPVGAIHNSVLPPAAAVSSSRSMTPVSVTDSKKRKAPEPALKSIAEDEEDDFFGSKPPVAADKASTRGTAPAKKRSRIHSDWDDDDEEDDDNVSVASKSSTTGKSKGNSTPRTAATLRSSMLPSREVMAHNTADSDELLQEMVAVGPPARSSGIVVKKEKDSEKEEENDDVSVGGRRSTRKRAAPTPTTNTSGSTLYHPSNPLGSQPSPAKRSRITPAGKSSYTSTVMAMDFIQPVDVIVAEIKKQDYAAVATEDISASSSSSTGKRQPQVQVPTASRTVDFDDEDESRSGKRRSVVVKAEPIVQKAVLTSKKNNDRSAFGLGANAEDDDDGWLTVERSEEQILAAQARRRVRAQEDVNMSRVQENDGNDDNNGHDPAVDNPTAAVEYPKAEVVERAFVLRSTFSDGDAASSSSSSSRSGKTTSKNLPTSSSCTSTSSSRADQAQCNGELVRNVKRFVKNAVRSVRQTEQLSLQHMQRVLPKETEREIQMRLELEHLALQEAEANQMFAERYQRKISLS